MGISHRRKTVKDKFTGQDVVLTDNDLEIIRKLQLGKLTGSGEAYEPFEDIFSHEVMDTPLSSRAPTKRSFLPSLSEKEKVSKLVYAIKMGLIKPARDWKMPTDETEEEEQTFYSLWTPEESVFPSCRFSSFKLFCSRLRLNSLLEINNRVISFSVCRLKEVRVIERGR